MKKIIFLAPLVLFLSCTTHRKANIRSNEEFIVELKDSKSRGLGVLAGAVDLTLQGVFMGALYLVEKTSKSLTNSYSRSISINDYYTVKEKAGIYEVRKTYDQIHIKKYGKPSDVAVKDELSNSIKVDYATIIEDLNSATSDNSGKPKTRGSASSLTIDEVIREKKDDLLNFHAVIGLISDEQNPGVTRLSFNELRILFSKTRIYKDENLNAKVSIVIEGQWRSTTGEPMTKTLIEQSYEFRNLKYGYENQIRTPIISPWYYDIPILSEIEDNSKYGVLKIIVRVEEFEGGKSKYINQLPALLNSNKSKIVKDGSSVIEKMMR